MVSKKSFTLVEVLVVITIITILAGMILGGIGGATTQSLKANTKSTLTVLTEVINKYKEEKGDYPWTTPTDINNFKTIITDLLKYNSFPISSGSNALIDGFGYVIKFVPSSAYSSTTAVQVNSALLPGVYYNPNSFQLISAGADGLISTPTGTIPFGSGANDGDNLYNFEKK